ncbi:MAG: GTPase Era [Alphaproteobacteria bacterium]|nr:GTPase Era [Alphaproteobacteria bacterium]
MTEARHPGGAAAETRAGFVAVLGAPNAGKSTLVNQLVGQKVSIVTPKPQTTRTRVLGIMVEGPAQLVLVDTPGIFAPQRRLDRAMVQAAWTAAEEADVALLLVDASAKRAVEDSHAIAERLAGLRAQRANVLALNKIDLVKREALLALVARLNGAGRFDATFMIAALSGDGVGDLKRDLLARMPESPWLYPPDDATTATQRDLAAEITREQLFLQLRQELPYHLAVETEAWEEFDDGSVRVQQVVTVARDSHKAMVIGKGGTRIKEVREKAQAELAAAEGRPVHLFLTVRVRENWAEDPATYKAMGLDWDA